MKIITINTQREFDELPDSLDEHTQIAIVGKLARINRNIGNAFISITGSAEVERICGFAIIERIYGKVGLISGFTKINSIFSSAKIGSICDSVEVGYIHDLAKVDIVCMNVIILHAFSHSIINAVKDYAIVNCLSKLRHRTCFRSRTKRE